MAAAGGPRRWFSGKKRRGRHAALSLVSLLVLMGGVVPESAGALGWSAAVHALRGKNAAAAPVARSGNVQTLALARPAMNINPAAGRGGGDITIVDGSALLPSDGPSGTIADIEKPRNGTISLYVVREGDTLSEIAELFDVSPNTIMWANNISSAKKLQIGQTLTILPITGIKYTVKKGDTLASIAKKYGGDAGEIANYNGLDDAALAVGAEIIIPDGEISSPSPSSPSSSGAVHASAPAGTSAQAGYYIAPLVRYTKTQGIHGFNGVDLGAPEGTQVVAAASGDVVVARDGGWNGGYGSYVVVSHGNGSQTLYSHLSSVTVYVGEHVVQGQVIGYVGQTGRATGPHLHFEIRSGVRNPF